MKRFGFAIFSSGGLDLTRNASDIHVYRDATRIDQGGTGEVTVVSNGDGSFYFDYSITGKYSIKPNGATQAEMTNLGLLGDDLGPVDDASIEVNGSGKIALKDGGITDAKLSASSVLLSGDVVDDLTTGGSSVPLSAGQGVALKALVDATPQFAIISPSEYAKLGNNESGITDADTYLSLTTTTSYVEKERIYFYKESWMNNMKVIFRSHAAHNASQEVKIMADGGATVFDTFTLSGIADGATITRTFDISGLANNALHYMQISLKGDGTNTIKLSPPVVLVTA